MKRLLLVIGLAAAALALPESAQAQTRCAVPDSMVFTEAALPRMARQIAARREIRIVVYGTSSSRPGEKKGLPQTYAALLPALLQARWPGIALRVDNFSDRSLTAEHMARRIAAEIAPSNPDLVIWQTGNVDAAQQIDVNSFGEALNTGLNALQARGVDALLIAPQYRARLSAMVDVAPYDAFLSQIAEARETLVFPRYDIMRHWSEQDVFDLRQSDQAKQLSEAEAENRCLAALLAEMIARAVQATR